MSNLQKEKNLSGRPTLSAFVAISLCASMLAFGCTTDRTLGNGDPVVTPGLRGSPTGGVSTGSESGTTPPPMMSSSTYSAAQSLPVVRARKGTRLTPDEAAAVMAQHQQQPRVRVLGPVWPGDNGRQYSSGQTFVNNAPPYSAPGYTINSSINSANNGLGTAGIANDLGATTFDPATGAVTTNGAVPNGATLAGGAGTTVTPTGATFSAPPGTFASVRTLTPTAATVVNPPASISGSPAVASATSARTVGSGTTATTPIATNGTTGTNLNTTTTSATVTPTSGGLANPVRVLNTDGRITVTNGGNTTRSTPSGTTSSRQQ